MFGVKVLLVIFVVTMKYQMCNCKCDNYYLLLERYVDFGFEQYRPFSKGNKKWTVLDINSNKTVTGFDMNCVLDVSCIIMTTVVKTIPKKISMSGVDTRFETNTIEFIPTTSNTPVEKLDPMTPHIQVTDPERKTSRILATESNLIQEIKSEMYTTDTPSTPASNQSEIATTNFEETDFSSEDFNEVYTVMITPDVTDTTDSTNTQTSTEKVINHSEETPVESLNTTVIDKNTTDSKNNTIGAFLSGDPEASKQITSKILAGTLGTAGTAAVLFAAKILIQQYLQSGVYRIPNP